MSASIVLRLSALILLASLGKRVLVIVGSAHKPWLDAYLDMMGDVQIVDAERVLR
jgi:hypothetical protein